MRYQNDEAYRKITLKSEECASLNLEIMSWKEVNDRLNQENSDLKSVIDDLESKNRKLVDKLNEQIYLKASEYKEKTL